MLRVPFLKFFFCWYFITNVSGQTKLLVNYEHADSLLKVGNFADAYSEFLEIKKSSLDDSLRANVYILLGYIAPELNKAEEGISYLKQSANLWSKLHNNVKLGRVYYNIANIYVSRKNYRDATEYFDLALKNAKQPKDSVNVYIGETVMCRNQKNYKVLYAVIKNDLSKFDSGLVEYQSYYCQQGLGAFYLNEKRYDSALCYLKEAALNPPNEYYKASILNDIAETYRGMKNYKMAFKYEDSSYAINLVDRPMESLLPDYDTYTALYMETGNFKKAIEFAIKGRQLSDTVFDNDRSNAMIDAEAKYKNEILQANAEIDAKDISIKNRNLIIAGIVLSLVALLAFAAIRNTRIKQKANRLLTHQKQQVQQLADQLALANDTKARLFSTIGHDLRSPVSSLYASLKMQELKGNSSGDEMSEQTIRLLDTLEELLIWSKSQMDGFKMQFVKINVRYFFEDLKVFYSDAAIVKHIAIENDTVKNIFIRTDENLLKTIFRNAISNAIANTAPGNSIYLNAIPTTENITCISVKNSCTPESFHKLKESFDDAIVKSGAYGLGIVLMKEFAQKLNGKIELAYVNGMACVSLHI